MSLIVNGAHREFIFTDPRDGLRSEGVRAGPKAFSGTVNGDEYQGTAYVFSKKCGVFGFQMKGTASSDQQRVTMSGRAPYVDAQCRIVGYHDAVYDFALVGGPVSEQVQEGPGQNEDFGEDGKLYSSEHSGTDVISDCLLNRHQIHGEEGLRYEGNIRTVTDILGGGFTNEENEYTAICSTDGDPYVLIRQGDNQRTITINSNLRTPEQAAQSAYNLWWATCKNQFQKFK